MLATAFQFTSEPAASRIANLVGLVMPLKCAKLEHPGSERHGSYFKVVWLQLGLIETQGVQT